MSDVGYYFLKSFQGIISPVSDSFITCVHWSVIKGDPQSLLNGCLWSFLSSVSSHILCSDNSNYLILPQLKRSIEFHLGYASLSCCLETQVRYGQSYGLPCLFHICQGSLFFAAGVLCLESSVSCILSSSFWFSLLHFDWKHQLLFVAKENFYKFYFIRVRKYGPVSSGFYVYWDFIFDPARILLI